MPIKQQIGLFIIFNVPCGIPYHEIHTTIAFQSNVDLLPVPTHINVEVAETVNMSTDKPKVNWPFLFNSPCRMENASRNAITPFGRRNIIITKAAVSFKTMMSFATLKSGT